ncbi:MAG: nucleotidyltransferase domain-containing protein [Candidatus Kuenenia sp.]|nr:nucleotidyltransferase domain-containing protein [Candidatus Kuenenia hertensis]
MLPHSTQGIAGWHGQASFVHIKQLVEKLKPLNPEKSLLFGGYALERPCQYRDIDWMVVLRDDFMPENFKENVEAYLKATALLRNLKRRISIDMIVYTRPMYERFVECT